MANIRALRSGIWHDTNPTTSPWGSGGQVFFPTSTDDVYLNNFTIQLTANATVNSHSNASKASGPWIYGDNVAATAGGTLNLGNGTIFTTLSVLNGGGTTGAISLSGINSAQFVGNIVPTFGGSSNHTAILNNSSGTLTIVGNLEGGGDVRGVINLVNGIVNITGNCLGKGVFGDAARNSTTGTLIVTGNVEGGTSTSQWGVQNLTTNGFVVITGNIKAGAGSNGITLNGGSANIIGNVEAVNGVAAINTTSTATNPIRISGNILNSPNGTAAIYAPSYRINPVPQNSYIRYARNGTGVGSDAYLYQYTTDSLSAFSMPPISAVRSGVQYANNTLTGTCQIPAPASVAFGVPVDNTVGTATLNPVDLMNVSVSSLTATNSLGARLKNSATVESVGRILASFSN